MNGKQTGVMAGGLAEAKDITGHLDPLHCADEGSLRKLEASLVTSTIWGGVGGSGWGAVRELPQLLQAYPCFSQCGPGPAALVSPESMLEMQSQAPPWVYGIQICILTRCPGAHLHVRSPEHTFQKEL